ncbi:MAG: class I adenylate-forming enzyme family protein [Pseudomonadota bacterium]
MNEAFRAEQILATSAARWPTHAAVIDQRGSYSFAMLHDGAQEVSSALNQAGIAPGAVIGVSMTEARNFLTTLFGVLQAGCIAIPVAPNLSQAERARVVAETGVAWVLTDGAMTSPSRGGAEANGRVLSLFGVSNICCAPQTPGARVAIVDVFPEAAVIRYTSGTTAKSKGVVLSHRAVLERAAASQQLLGVTHEDVVLAPLPLSYHFVASALSCVRAGATILDSTDLIAPEILEFGAQQGATICYASPIQYELMSRKENDHRLPSLRRAISTSALLPKRTADGFFDRFGVRLTQVYGIIEVGLPLWNEFESIESTALGVCKAPYEAIAVDDHGKEVQTGEVGELAIRGPGLFSGYLLGDQVGSSPRLARACMLAGEWFLTGDLVVRDELGVILYRGRKKSVINCGGNKIFPEEVEEVLRRTPDIIAVRVSAEPHPLLGSLVIAEVVVDPSQQPSVDSWRALCYKELSGYKVPKEFRIVESLPITGSGKLVRHSDSNATSTV